MLLAELSDERISKEVFEQYVGLSVCKMGFELFLDYKLDWYRQIEF